MNSELKIKIVSRVMAQLYASGWKQHAEHVGEMVSHLTPKEWADCNSSLFTTDAIELLKSLDNDTQQIQRTV